MRPDVTSEESLIRLQRLARRWGGDIVQARKRWPRDVSVAPFNSAFGLSYERKVVYFTRRGMECPRFAACVIHEMGHAFASLTEPDQCYEYAFFGWEYVVARQLGLLDVWREEVRGYNVPAVGGGRLPYIPFEELSEDGKAEILRDRVASAKSQGLLTKSGKARAIR